LDGCSYHRVFMPNNHLDAEVRTVSNLKEEDLEWCDILHYSRHVMISPAFISQQAKKYNVKVVVDTDDWWEVGKDHPKYNLWKKSDVGLQIKQHLMYADAVIATSDRLASIVPNKNVYVIPNALAFDVGQFREHELPKSDKVRLVYASSAMNYANTFLIAKAMKKLVDLPIEIVVVGYHEGDVYDIIIQNLTANKQIPYRTIEWTGTENYMEGYQGDILIVPSKATEFNSYKSNIKALEAAALNIPIVVSKAEPYLGLQVNYFSGDNEFVSEITRLVQSEEYKKHSAKKNRDFCLENYSLDKWSKERLNIYQKILDDSRQ
jgi:glycosyltransferase involved in cell wall biosynthesis